MISLSSVFTTDDSLFKLLCIEGSVSPKIYFLKIFLLRGYKMEKKDQKKFLLFLEKMESNEELKNDSVKKQNEF